MHETLHFEPFKVSKVIRLVKTIMTQVETSPRLARTSLIEQTATSSDNACVNESILAPELFPLGPAIERNIIPVIEGD